MKNIIYSIITMSIILLMFTTDVYAYENSTYKIDIPNNYLQVGNEDIKIFMKDKSNMICVYSMEVKNNRDIASLSNTELKEVISTFEKTSDSNMQIIDNEKGKLGNTKALHLSVQQNGLYGDLYLMSSNKHYIVVLFMSENKEDLNSTEFIKIKDSFKMKEKFIDVKTVAGVAGLVIVGVIGFIKKRKKAQ